MFSNAERARCAIFGCVRIVLDVSGPGIITAFLEVLVEISPKRVTVAIRFCELSYQGLDLLLRIVTGDTRKEKIVHDVSKQVVASVTVNNLSVDILRACFIFGVQS